MEAKKVRRIRQQTDYTYTTGVVMKSVGGVLLSVPSELYLHGIKRTLTQNPEGLCNFISSWVIDSKAWPATQ